MNLRPIFDWRLLLLAAMSLQLAHAAPVWPEDINSQESAPRVRKAVEDVPKFLLDVYECWSKDNDESDCLPEVEGQQVNIIRSLVGRFDVDPLVAVQSYDQKKHVENSISFVFNSSSSSAMISEDVLYRALLRVHKSSLSQDQISSLQSLCNLEDLELQVYSTVNVNSNNEQVVKLEETMSFGSLSKSEWLSFLNMKHIYQNILQQSQVLRLHFVIGGSCQGISPALFGIAEPELIGYVNNQVEDKAILSNLRSTIQNQRQKRQADTDGETIGSGVGIDFENDTRNYNRSNPRLRSREPVTIADFKKAKCHLYEFNVSFVDIGWGLYVIRPLAYKANFCAGRCTWPLETSDESPINYTKHSFIQSIVNHAQPNLVPPPCCAPSPGTLQTLAVVIRDKDNVFAVHKWQDMIAPSCGCL